MKPQDCKGSLTFNLFDPVYLPDQKLTTSYDFDLFNMTFTVNDVYYNSDGTITKDQFTGTLVRDE